jgi:hypothetical protein
LVRDIHVDAQGLLWLLLDRPTDARQPSHTSQAPADGAASLTVGSVVEVYDGGTSELIASTAYPQNRFRRFLANGLVQETIEGTTGAYYVVLWRVLVTVGKHQPFRRE